MDKRVTVLTPNGRRQNVNVNPNTTLLQILEEACRKHGFESDEYELRHHNKEVGLTQMFRFSGLPNNCLLEMWYTERRRAESNVAICLHLEDGVRQQAQFVPSDHLWHVIEQLSPEAVSTYKSPVAIYMRQEIIGKINLMNTTLRSLGITAGRAMIRLLDKQPEDLKSQANVYIAPGVKETLKGTGSELRSARATAYQASGSGGFAITKELVQSLKKPETKSADTTEQVETSADNSNNEPEKHDWGAGSGRSMRDSPGGTAQQAAAEVDTEVEMEPEINVIGERSALIYSLDTSQRQIEDLPDSFFDLTVNDLKLVLRGLKKIAAGNDDMPLLTEKLRELEDNKIMLNKIAQYKNCVIRIQFPSRYVLQGIFKPIDKISDVMDFVRKFIQKPEYEFYLFTIPPKTVLPLNKTLLELNFVPTAVIHYGSTDNRLVSEQGSDGSESELKIIRAEFLQKLTTPEGALYAANKLRISIRKHETIESDSFTSNTSSKPPGVSTGAIPKRPRNGNFQKAM